ncbi:MAG: hypothetical protein HY735_37950 [Verrucomicrobia bacterium]|nr:hypothetical protein [Verrucomicrobiota bacterium]
MPNLKLITLDPGHFHAALFQKEMLPGVCEQAYVYAPLGPDLLAHLNRIAQFNTRPVNPTRWNLEIRTGADFIEQMLAQGPGNIVVISGNNRGKIDRLLAIVRAGMHVLADKPWVIEPSELPKLKEVLEAAERKGVAAFDAMTQRFEISCWLQMQLVGDPAVFGTCLTGSVQEPAVRMESVHYLLKKVAGAPMLRPAWFFDIHQQGEGLADVGTHLVDLVQWILFPEQAIDYRSEIQVLRGERWPTVLTREQFQRVTGRHEFPEVSVSGLQGTLGLSKAQQNVLAFPPHPGPLPPGEGGSFSTLGGAGTAASLRARASAHPLPAGEGRGEGERAVQRPSRPVSSGSLEPKAEIGSMDSERFDYFANNSVHYTIRGIHVRLDIKWDYEPPRGGRDTELAIVRGTKARVEVRQGKEEDFLPELFVVPNRTESRGEVLLALRRKIDALRKTYPLLELEEQTDCFRINIPDAYRIGHEAHFGLLSRQFLDYVRDPRSLPAWEKPNMLAKYYVTTKGVELGRRAGAASR